MTDEARIKAAFAPLQVAMRDFAEGPVRSALDSLLRPDAMVHLCHPFGEAQAPQAL